MAKKQRPRITNSDPLPRVTSEAGKRRLDAALRTLRAYEKEIAGEMITWANAQGDAFALGEAESKIRVVTAAVERLSTS